MNELMVEVEKTILALHAALETARTDALREAIAAIRALRSDPNADAAVCERAIRALISQPAQPQP